MNNSYLKERYAYYLELFSQQTTLQLVATFNKEVGSNAWTSERSAYVLALVDSFIAKRINIGCIKPNEFEDDIYSFTKEIAYDERFHCLVIN